MNQEIVEDEVLTCVSNGVGYITLNRPKALNALSLEMIRVISSALRKWEADDCVRVVVFHSNNERAFCSGGDVKSFYHTGMDYRRGNIDHSVSALYFSEEYSLNRQIFHYSKPTLAFMDGIVMGGGYGIGGHCKYRIATPKTVFAMPEVGIGLFPDIGATYYLNQAPHYFGRFLALTGASVKAGDMIAGGFAEYFVESQYFEGLCAALEAQSDIDAVLHDFVGGVPEAEILSQYSDEIEQVFSKAAISDIFEALRGCSRDFADMTFEWFSKASPLSVCVTLRHLKALEGASFDAVIEADFLRVQRFIQFPDLYEGIRAALIHRDRKPVWDPPTFNKVSEEQVERYFKETGCVL